MNTAEKIVPSEKGFSAPPAKGSHDFPKPNGNNTEINKTEYNNTDLSFPPSPPEASAFAGNEQKGRIWIDEMDSYRELIRENIDYDLLLEKYPLDMELLDGYVELMAEVCCSQRGYTRIGGEKYPTAAVKSRFLKLNHEHIVYMIDCGWAAWTSVQPVNDICKLIETYGDRLGFIGGFDSQGPAAREDATSEHVVEEVRRCLDTYGKYHRAYCFFGFRYVNSLDPNALNAVMGEIAQAAIEYSFQLLGQTTEK